MDLHYEAVEGGLCTHRSDVASVDRGIRVAHQNDVVDASAKRCHLSEVHDEICKEHTARTVLNATFSTSFQQ